MSQLRRQPGLRLGRVNHPHDEIGLIGTGHGPADPFLLDRTRRLADARRIAYHNWQTFEIKTDLDHVARCPCLLGDDRRFAFRERVEQARLADIGSTGQGHAEAIAQDFAAPAVIEMTRESLVKRENDSLRACGRRSADIALIREVDGGLDQGKRLDQRGPPSLVQACQRPVGLTQGLSPLPFGFGIDEVGEPLGLGQIDPAVVERTARELAGLRQPAACDFPDGAKHGLHHGPAAVNVQLDDVLARETAGPLKP